jgi:hypothetical protein
LSWFCWYAAFAVAYIFIFQITIFTPALTFNKKRTDKNRLDCCCCIGIIPKLEEQKFDPEEAGGMVGQATP